jgi:hypothetical protein
LARTISSGSRTTSAARSGAAKGAIVRSRWWLKLLWFLVALGVAFGIGAFRGTMSGAESVHFSINYPAQGKDAGGPGPTARLGFVAVDVSKIGFLKAWIQPRVVNLSSHWLRNIGDKPLRIRLAMEGIKSPVRWDSTEKTWDEERHAIGRTLAPGETVTVDWFITLPDPLPVDASVVEKGRIAVYDADSGALLSALPVSVVNTAAGAVVGGDCCAP